MESSARLILRLLDQANHLKRLPRTGWLLAGLTDVESVAEHSYGTALLSMILAEMINADWAKEGLYAPLNGERVLRMALIHDLAESVLTDLPKRSSELIGIDVKHRAEEQAMSQLLADLPHEETYLALWTEYTAETSPEARLVHDADGLEMAHQALCYRRRGQTNLQEFWEGHRWHFAASARLFDAIVASESAVT